MKKILMSTLTAGLAFAMISTYSVQAEGKETTGNVIFKGKESVELKEVSPSFSFGMNDVESKEINKKADNDVYITVSDERGTAKGWEVKASFSGFYMTESDGVSKYATLKNSSLSLNPKKATNKANNEKLSRPGMIFNDVLKNEDEKVVKAEPGNNKNFDESEGLGEWEISWTPSLSIPAAEANEGNHSGVITWTMEDAPTF